MRKLIFFLFTILSFPIVVNASFPVTEDYNFTEELCDNIILKNGEEISAKIIEITPDLIKYKRCDNLDGPLISIYKEEVLMLRYNDGTKEIIRHGNSKGLIDNKKSEVPILGICSLSFSLIALLIPLPLYFAAFFTGAGALAGLAALDDKYWGFGLAGLIIGLININILMLVL